MSIFKTLKSLLSRDDEPEEYSVSKGDTLSSIAKKNNTDVSSLMKANKIKDANLIQPKQKIIIPKKEIKMPSSVKANSNDYNVKQGDTLSSIAKNNNTSLLKLLEINNLENPDILNIGTKLKMPVNIKQQRVSREKNNNYVIKRGDNLFDIAKNNNLNLQQLLDANPLIKNSNQINVGREITVPQFGNTYKAEAEARRNLPIEESQESFIPSNLRQLAYDINPITRLRRKLNMGQGDFTEGDLTKAEYKAAKLLAKRALEEGRNNITYDDFATGDDVGGGGRMTLKKAYLKFKDPMYSLKTLVGRGTLEINNAGETIIVDRYNFNEPEASSMRDYAQKIARVASDPLYGTFREAGSLFGSNEGEGSYVRLNLGKL